MDINVKCETPLHIALKYKKSIEIVHEILKRKFNVNTKDKEGNTPIFVALNNFPYNIEIFKELLKHGASVWETDENGNTPLHIAVISGTSLEIIQELLKYGADCNAKNVNGETPLSAGFKLCYSFNLNGVLPFIVVN